MKTGWEARLNLRYVREAARTVLCEKSHVGPLVVQKALYPEGDAVCHSIIVHPPGGIAGGDQLSINAAANAGAQALFTTPGATRWYRTLGPLSRQRVQLSGQADATIEWLPQESIYFDATHAHNSLDVELQSGASFIGWEIACLGRQRAGELFTHGRVRQAMSIRVDRLPVFVERGALAADDAMLVSPIGLAGNKVYATFMAHSPRCNSRLLDQCREVAVPDGMRAGLTLIGDTLIGRALGESSETVRGLFVNWWKMVREPIVGLPAVAPRIWQT